MFVSVFDIFKISVGPSSSHTMGPMLAARAFVDNASTMLPSVGNAKLSCTLYGSLAYTGEGHGTHRAVLAGFLGLSPQTYDREAFAGLLDKLGTDRTVTIAGRIVDLDPETAIVVDRRSRLDKHPNGMIFHLAGGDGGLICEETYYSVGGGFVLTAAEMESRDTAIEPGPDAPYAFDTAAEMLQMGDESGLSVAEMKRRNELAKASAPDQVGSRLAGILDGNECIDRARPDRKRRTAGRAACPTPGKRRGCQTQGCGRVEFGPVAQCRRLALRLRHGGERGECRRRAGGHRTDQWRGGGRSGGDALLSRTRARCRSEKIGDMLLTAAAIGGLIKYNASISGAEVGCQGEVGSASAMAAAALCAALGGNNAQVENAAEIALEHHLGMTCDPVKGLVQVPCIERNGLGRGQGGGGRITGAGRGRAPFRAARRLHRDHAPDRPRHGRALQGNLAGRAKRVAAGMLTDQPAAAQSRFR